MGQTADTGGKRSASGRRARTKTPSVPMLAAPGVEVEALLRSTLDSLSAHVAVLDARAPEAGPVARAWFDHFFPFTFHGTWVPTV